MSNKSIRRSLLLVLACASVSMSLRAQQAVVEDNVLEEIVVTSQRREEKLQDVPISVAVVGSEQLALQNVNSLQDLAQTTPSVRIDAATGRASPITMRGIGSGNGQAFDQSVAMFIDDIYYGRSRFTSATFLDVDRVEILKGPQSTFFGNSAIAGALNIVTKKPGDQTGGSARALYGEYGQYALEGAMGGPITDTFGARVALIAEGQDGWLTNVNIGGHEPDEENRAGRLTLAFNPSEDLSATLKVERAESKSSGLPLQVINCPRPSPPYAPTTDAGLLGSCAVALATNVPVGLDTEKLATGAQRIRLEHTASVLNINYMIGEHTFSSVTGYQDSDYEFNLDADALPNTFLNGSLPEQYHQFSQEFQITSPDTGRFEYMAGAYFQRGKLRYSEVFSLFSVGPFIGGVPPGRQIDFAQNEDSYSAFASVSWNATDRVKLTGGVRGSWVDKDYDYRLFWGAATQPYGGIVPYAGTLCTPGSTPATGDQAFAAGLFRTPACAFSGSRKDDDVYPSVNIQYRIDPRTMVYVRFDKSFKAGGFNGSDTSGNPANLQFDPEYVDAYEAGIKTTLLQGSLVLNLAVFHMDYDDLQVTINEIDANSANVLNVVRNSASSRSKGVELETQWAPSSDLLFSASATYLDAHYIDYRNSSLSFLQIFCASQISNSYCASRFPSGVDRFGDLSGSQMLNAPEWSGTVAASYSHDIWGEYRLTGQVDAVYSDDWYYNIVDELDGDYWMLGAQLTLAGPDKRWAFDVIGKNLTNEHVQASGRQGTGQTSPTMPPRMLAAQVRYQF